MDEDEQALYSGLQALSDDAFPKKCNNCGRCFESPQAFIEQSETVLSGSGLKKSLNDDGLPEVMLFRTCLCGSTLMDFFSDRRTTSGDSATQRARFDELLSILHRRGLDIEAARIELRRLMRGDTSPLLERMGIHLETRK